MVVMIDVNRSFPSFYKIIEPGPIENKCDINNSGEFSDIGKCMGEIIKHYMKIKTVETKNSDAPFEQAINCGDVEKVREIIEAGRDVNKEFENGDTPLERAIDNNQPEIVTLLIEQGALLTPHLNNDGLGYKLNPLALAIANKDQDMMDILIKEGMDIRYQSSEKDSLLFYAYNMDCQRAVEMLLKSGADINQKNEKGRCLLEQAIKDENKGMVELLISNGVTIDSIIERKLWGLNNIHTKLKQGYLGKIGEFIMIHTMKKMITQSNDSEAPTIHDLSATEKQIIERMINNTDGVHLDHTGCIGHATCTLTMTGETNYLFHTNRGDSAKKNTDGKARPMVICSEDDSKMNDVKNQLLEFKKTENSMGRPNQMLEHFQSDGGNQQFIKAVESIAAKSQTMGNCWIKSYNQALKIRLFIGF